VNKTQLPALVEQKPVPVSREAGDTRQVEEFHPLTLTAVVEETFLVVNYINDGKPSNPYVYKRPPPYIFYRASACIFIIIVIFICSNCVNAQETVQ